MKSIPVTKEQYFSSWRKQYFSTTPDSQIMQKIERRLEKEHRSYIYIGRLHIPELRSF